MAKEKMEKLGFRLKPLSVRIIIAFFSLFMLIAAFAFFSIIDLTDQYLTLLKISALIVIFTEVGLATVFKTSGRSLDTLGVIGIVVGLATLISIVLSLFQITGADFVLNPIQGVLFAVLVISFFIEALR